MKIDERLLERRIRITDQFGFMPGKRTEGRIFIVRRMQEEYLKEKKLYTCSLGTEKAFYRVPRKMMKRDMTTKDYQKQ